jgi:CubicO group peptidase (beta-lactamase class C family)
MRSYTLLILGLLSTLVAVGQITLSTTQMSRLDSIATQDVPPRAPGIATVIVRDGEVIYEKCAGLADLTDSTVIQNTSRFNIASNGKQFTALALLTLVDAKKLKLSDDIRKWFPNLLPTVKEKITVQHLLTHTSGLRDCYDLWALQGYTWWKKTFDNTDVLALMEKQEGLNFSPGARYLYSNTNYILLALLIERVSGKRFVAYTREMFGKLYMPNTSFEDDHTRIQGPLARAYFNFGTWTNYNWIWNACGDGSLFSTLADQIQWEKLVQGKSRSEIKQEIIVQSQQPIKGAPFKNYGYGLEFGQYKGKEYAFHEGATGAWKATVIRFPGDKLSMITLTNTGKSVPSMQTRQMADVVFNLPATPRNLVTKPATVGKFVSEEEITGIYLTESDFSFQFEKTNGKLLLKRNGRNDVELEREGSNIFHQKSDSLFKQEFTVSTSGDVQVTAYYINHAPYTLTKKTADYSAFPFQALAGKFLNAETNTLLEISHSTDKAYQVKIGTRNATKGQLAGPGKLLVNQYSVHFETVGSTIAALYLNGDRIKQVKFTRQE